MIQRFLDWLFPSLTPILLALLAGAFLLAGVQTVRFHQKTTQFEQFRRATADASLARAQEYTSSELRARANERRLSEQIRNLDQAHHDATEQLTGRVADLLERLRRERAKRPLPAPGQPNPAASTAAGCTGAGLYRPDGEFLIGFAAQAARIGLERDACIHQYNAASQTLSTTP